jgi:hypothetical protein
VISNAEQQSAFASVVCRAGVLAGEPLANCVAECEPNDQGDCSFQHEGTDRLNMDRCRDEDPALACHGENAKGGVSGTLLERKEMRLHLANTSVRQGFLMERPAPTAHRHPLLEVPD